MNRYSNVITRVILAFGFWMALFILAISSMQLKHVQETEAKPKFYVIYPKPNAK